MNLNTVFLDIQYLFLLLHFHVGIFSNRDMYCNYAVKIQEKFVKPSFIAMRSSAACSSNGCLGDFILSEESLPNKTFHSVLLGLVRSPEDPRIYNDVLGW